MGILLVTHSLDLEFLYFLVNYKVYFDHLSKISLKFIKNMGLIGMEILGNTSDNLSQHWEDIYLMFEFLCK
jgi:hypothetical protein